MVEKLIRYAISLAGEVVELEFATVAQSCDPELRLKVVGGVGWTAVEECKSPVIVWLKINSKFCWYGFLTRTIFNLLSSTNFYCIQNIGLYQIEKLRICNS